MSEILSVFAIGRNSLKYLLLFLYEITNTYFFLKCLCRYMRINFIFNYILDIYYYSIEGTFRPIFMKTICEVSSNPIYCNSINTISNKCIFLAAWLIEQNGILNWKQPNTQLSFSQNIECRKLKKLFSTAMKLHRLNSISAKSLK